MLIPRLSPRSPEAEKLQAPVYLYTKIVSVQLLAGDALCVG